MVSVARKMNSEFALMQAYYEKGAYANAGSSYIDTVYSISKKLNNKEYQAASLAYYGDREDKNKNPERAIEYFLKSARLSEEIGKHDFTVYRYIDLASLFRRVANPEKQLLYCKKSLDLAIQIKDTTAIDISYQLLANYYIRQKDAANADLIIDSVMKWADHTGLKSRQVEAMEVKAEWFALKGMYKPAIELMKEALELVKQAGKWKQVIHNNIKMAYIYYDAKFYDDALKCVQDAVKLMDEKKSGIRKDNSLELLYKIYAAKNDSRNALFYFEKLMQHRDSVESVEKVNKLHELETIYQSEKKDKEIKLLSKEKELKEIQIQQQRSFIYTTIGFILLMILVVVFGYRSLAHKRKAAALLAEFDKQQRILNERMRIASELHDDLGSGLTKISLMSQVAGSIAGDRQQHTLKKITTESSEMVDKMNGIIWALNTKNDTLPNLISFIRKHAFEMFEESEIKIIWNAPEEILDVNVSGEVRRNIYLLMKEALHNALKYSEAKQVEIKIDFENGNLKIAIVDNGKGFDLASIDGKGNGLANMKKRMEEIGGQLEISSADKKGATIRLSCQLADYTKV